MNIIPEDFAVYGKKVLEQLQTYAETKSGWTIAPNNYEGVRVSLDADHSNGLDTGKLKEFLKK